MADVSAAPLSKAEVDRIIEGNLTDEFWKLKSTPGYRVTRCSWQQALELCADGSVEALGSLGRAPADHVKYRRFRKQVLSDWKSVPDYVVCKVFECQPTVLEGKKKAAPDMAKTFTERKTVFRPNDFPYFFEAGITHDNVWCTEPLAEAELQQVISAHIGAREHTSFLNPPQLASIPGVWHAHCLSRPAQQTE